LDSSRVILASGKSKLDCRDAAEFRHLWADSYRVKWNQLTIFRASG
jgi:hypothetical protein